LVRSPLATTFIQGACAAQVVASTQHARVCGASVAVRPSRRVCALRGLAAAAWAGGTPSPGGAHAGSLA
ncbi:hypothetical protein OFN60_36345, partial [Escherichia coli]|nr:hypothetical protein [Escherichia coli]